VRSIPAIAEKPPVERRLLIEDYFAAFHRLGHDAQAVIDEAMERDRRLAAMPWWCRICGETGNLDNGPERRGLANLPPAEHQCPSAVDIILDGLDGLLR
jgi:hypothetical protein